MMNRHGYTLAEIFVTMIILVLMTQIVVTGITSTAEHGRVHQAKVTLYAMLAAQQKYYEENGGWAGNAAYCVGACGASNQSLRSNLDLTLTDTFTYLCTNNTLPYICTAVDGIVTLTLNPNNNPPVTCAPVGPFCPPS